MAYENGGWDINFHIENFSNGYIDIVTDDLIISGGQSGMTVRILDDGAGKLFASVIDPTEKVQDAIELDYPVSARTVDGIYLRIITHDDFISFFRAGNSWAGTLGVVYIRFAAEPNIQLENHTGEALDCDLLMVHELDDWREAIWMDVENDAQNAVGTVIQERPVEIVGKADGSVAFFYFPFRRPEIFAINLLVEDYQIDYSMNRTLSSDAIVYGNDIGVSVDLEVAKNFGMVTRTIRIPNLDNGYMKAAKIMQMKARQSLEQHQLLSRVLPQLEVGDALIIKDYAVPGSNEIINERFAVEQIDFQLIPTNRMTVSGRSDAMTYSPVPRPVVDYTQYIQPASISSQNAFGIPSVGLLIDVAGIASQEQFESPTIG